MLTYCQGAMTSPSVGMALDYEDMRLIQSG